MRRYIIFDLDGTLVDSNAICVEILQEMLEDRGSTRRIDPVASAPHMSLGGEHMVRTLLAKACADPKADLADFRARYARRTTSPGSIFAGVADGLQRLAQAGFELAICSNKPVNLCTKVLADTGLNQHFGVVVGGAQGLRPKPAPDLLDATLAQLGASAVQCLFVGDSDLDHAIAADAQIPFCFMTYGYAEPGWTPSLGESFGEFGQLVEYLLANAPLRHDA